MADYSGFNYTNVRGINLRNTSAIRIEGDAGFIGTVSFKASPDASRAWQFPDKSGTIGVMGTILVNLPAISANNIVSTIVTVSGIRAEDALIVQGQDLNPNISSRGIILLATSTPGNGNMTLNFVNVTGTTGIYRDLILSYATSR